MAAGRDIARHTSLIRKRQRIANAKALADEEQRRTEQERLSGMKPSEIRREEDRLRQLQRSERKQEAEDAYQDKMDRGEGSANKGGEGAGADADGLGEGGTGGNSEGGSLTPEAVRFASSPARSLAEEYEFGPEILNDFVASSRYGFTKQDIIDIKVTIDALESEDDEDDEDDRE